MGTEPVDRIIPTIPSVIPSLGTVTAARAWRKNDLILGAGWGKIPLDAIYFDLGNNIDLTRGLYVVNSVDPTSGVGYYQVNANVVTPAGSIELMGIYQNGLQIAVVGVNSQGNWPIAVSDILKCALDDTIELWAWGQGEHLYQSPGGIDQGSGNYISIVRVA